jgi:hypothetical protein
MTLRAPARLFLFASFLSALGTAGPSIADSIQLPSVADNTLYENVNGSFSNGAGSGMFAGRTGQISDPTRRALVRFDLAAAIPAGSTITSVQLGLTQTMGPILDETFSVHRVLASWGEGTSLAPSGQGGGAASTPNDATWRHRFFNTTQWASLGGDFAPGALTSAVVGDLGPYAWPSSPAFVAAAQSMLDAPAGNFGFLLKGDESADGTAKRFATKEYPVAESRPTLIVEYTPPGVPAVSATWGAMKSLYR